MRYIVSTVPIAILRDLSALDHIVAIILHIVPALVLPLPPSTELIAGSERPCVKVVDIGILLRMLYGCGDDHIYIINIFALKYLQATNQDEPNVRAKAIRYFKSGSSFLYSECFNKI